MENEIGSDEETCDEVDPWLTAPSDERLWIERNFEELHELHTAHQFEARRLLGGAYRVGFMEFTHFVFSNLPHMLL
jgi:hypothetical protein